MIATIAELAAGLGRICGRMAPLFADSADGVFRSLGLAAPPGLLATPAIASAITGVADAAAAVEAATVELQQARGRSDGDGGAMAAAAMLSAMAGVAAALEALESALDAASTTFAGLSTQQRTELRDFAGALIPMLRDRVLTDEWRERAPHVSATLLGTGLVEIVDDPGGGAGSLRVASSARRLRPDRLSKLLRDPLGHLGDFYGWGTPAFDGARLFQVMQAMLADHGYASDLLVPPGLPASLEAFWFRLELDPTASPPGLDAALRFPANVSTVASETVDGWQFPVEAAVQFNTDVELQLQPPLALSLRSAAETARVTIAAAASRSAESDQFLLLGDGESSRMEARGVKLGVAVDTGPLDAAGVRSANLQLAAELQGGNVVISGSGSSLVARVLGGRDLSARFDVAATWDLAGGLRFSRAPALEVDVPVDANLGPVFVDVIHLGVTVDGDGAAIEVSADAGAKLGPLTVTLERVGMRAHLALAERTGNLGFAQLDIDWQPPRGAGLAVDAGPVKGGGAVSIDPETGTYSGTIALEVFDIGFSATGIITTHPFSLLLVVSVDTPGIPIGLGFMLDGVGGLVALDRGADVEALRAAIRGGGMNDIFFAPDPVAHAARLVGDLGRYFPVAEGRYLFGPAAKIGWGQPRVFSAVVALLVELPAPIRLLLLAQLRLGLPSLEHAIVDIRLDALGVLDVERKTFALDASLHDSTLAGYPLTGDMALRLGWGSAPHFLFSVGGFHPHFSPPAGFPVLRRLALTAGDNPQLRLSCYLALTSNTAQVGAQADLTASGGGFAIQAHIGFDALFEFVPFHFEIEIAASASIAWHGHHLVGMDLDFLLTGPHPWHAKGHASFSILWWDVSVGFDTTWGDATPEALPPPPDVLAALRDALQSDEAWVGELPEREPAWVVFSGTAAAGTTIVHPFASLVVRERAVPLDHDINQFGNIPLAGSQRYTISTVKVGTDGLTPDSVTDAFAPGQFSQLTADQKLSAPSFEQLHSGVRIARDEAAIGATARVSLDVLTTVDDPYAPPARVFPPVTLTTTLAAFAAAVRPTRPPPPPRQTGPKLRELSYTLVSTSDLSPTADGTAIARGATSYSGLREALRAHAGGGVRAALQIVPRTG